MRAYTLAVLQDLQKSGKPISDHDIINWANEKLSAAGKSSHIDSFKDPRIADGKVVIDLIDSLVPGCIRYELVKDADSDEVPFFIHSFIYLSLFCPFITCISVSGSASQRQICCVHGSKDWSTYICPTR